MSETFNRLCGALNQIYTNQNLLSMLAPYQKELIDEWYNLGTHYTDKQVERYFMLQGKVSSIVSNLLAVKDTPYSMITFCLETIRLHPSSMVNAWYDKIFKVIGLVEESLVGMYASDISNILYNFYMQMVTPEKCMHHLFTILYHIDSSNSFLISVIRNEVAVDVAYEKAKNAEFLFDLGQGLVSKRKN